MGFGLTCEAQHREDTAIPYTHLTPAQRRTLEELLREGFTRAACARHLGVNRSTITREIKRNADRGGKYSAAVADDRARERRVDAKRGARKIERDPKLRRFVKAKLKAGWSPETIAGALEVQRGEQVISHQAIYRFRRQRG